MEQQQQLPWEKPTIKRVIDIFGGHVAQIKKLSSINREVKKDGEDDEIQR